MASYIGRRELLAALGGAAAAWPLAARAQGAKRPTIGLLGGATASAQTQWTAAFVQRLRELGWVEGKTVAIEYRWVEGRFERSTRDHRRVRPTQGRCHCHACDPKRSGCEASDIGIPIVFASAGDPVGNGSSPALRAPVLMSQAYRSSQPIWLTSRLNCYATSSRSSAAWRSCTMSAIRSQRCKRMRLRQWRAGSVSLSL